MNLYLADDNEFIDHCSKIVLDNLGNENFGVTEFINATGLNRRYLSRRIKSIKKITINQFITEVKLEKAREFLLEGTYTASEVSYNVGFSSPSYFTRCFHKHFGYPPSEVKNHITPGKSDKSESKIREPEPVRKKRWVQVAITAAIFIVVVFISSEVFYYRPFEKGSDNTKNTIAIMPFLNDSGEEFAPFTAWMGIEIGNKLGKIENMLVVPQSTTETYRDSKKSNRDIARELLVDHILRGRTIKTGDKILLNIELLDAKNGQSLFTEIYERNNDESEETTINRIFEICGDVVFQISEALKTDLTQGEKDEVAKKTTENMAALRAFQEAIQHYKLSEIYEHSNVSLAKDEFMKAKMLCEDALKIDSTFADAHTMLGRIYVNRLPYYANIYLADKYLVTGKIHLEKAIMYDKNNLDAASYLRWYYLQKGLLNEADKLLPVTENRIKNYAYYMNKLVEYGYLNDRYHVAEAYLNYMETKPNDMPPRDFMTTRAFDNYRYMGFPVRARELNEENRKSVHDSYLYLIRKANLEMDFGSKDSALAIRYQIHKINPENLYHLYYGVLFSNFQGDYAKALDTLKKYEEEILTAGGSISPRFETGGFTYLKNGMQEKAYYHFQGSIKQAEDAIKLNSASARAYYSHFNLALIYAILNDKQKSLQYLEMIKESKSVTLFFINDLKTNPMFDNVRNEPEFQKITNDLEKKYLDEHEKIKKLLISHGLEPV